jgi:glycine cleavage system H protein
MIELQGFYGQTVEIAEDRLYDGAEELWVQDRGEIVRVGVTKVGVLLMGGIESTEFFVEAGDEVGRGEDVVFFETFKAVRYVVSPLAGWVIAVNEPVIDDPELFDDDPYGEAWLLELRLATGERLPGSLLSPRDYTAALERSEHCAEGAEVLLEVKKGSPTCRSLYGGLRGTEPGEGHLSWRDEGQVDGGEDAGGTILGGRSAADQPSAADEPEGAGR